MITVEFFNFAKRKNSTALPTGAASATASVLLKEDCTLENPVFILETNSIAQYALYNYIHVSEFGRYYFIENRKYKTGSQIQIECSIDAMGSFKNEIAALSNVFIEYSSAPTTNVIDGRLPRKTTPIITESYGALSGTTFTSSGCVLISSAGNKSTGLYILSNAGDIYTLLDGIDWTQVPYPTGATPEDAIISSCSQMMDIAEQFFTKDSATRNIRNAFTLPWTPHQGVVGQAVTNYVIGSFPTGKTVYKINQKVVTDHVVLNIPWSFNDYRKSGRFCSLVLYAPLFGMMTLPADSLINDTQIDVLYSFSYENGDIAMRVKGVQSDQIICTGTANASAPVGIGNSNLSNTKISTAATATILGLATVLTAGSDMALLAGAAAAGGAAWNLNDAMSGSVTGGGGLGGFASMGLDKVVHIWCIQADTSDTPANMSSALGYPNFTVGSLAGKSGYTKLKNAVFGGTGSKSENDIVTGYLNSGFYLE